MCVCVCVCVCVCTEKPPEHVVLMSLPVCPPPPNSLQAAEERVLSAEKRCSELQEDLQKVLDWIASGQLVGFTIHTYVHS